MTVDPGEAEVTLASPDGEMGTLRDVENARDLRVGFPVAPSADVW